ncbi:GntR family transcriptional regulator [Lentibacillus populi]|uniref:GntR family transcriptional regulator n=1 Tax=Lentibacillus populi TaxID=1827502 RepID=A0A9W5X5A7_9BACI|nr:GntR family transcriptional regulator [Lentibacillus populi]GGB38935.1 GntR family transcriptional regulator [Lentibacillus populi]
MESEINKRISQQSRSVRDLIYEGLKEAILNGTYEPGFHLRERELSKQFQVSTTPIKEALRQLGKEGLVVTQPRKGTFVSKSVMSSVEEITWARAALEGVAARLAAIKRTDEDLKKLDSIIKRMEQFTGENNTQKLRDYNSEFHHLICQIAKNDYIANQVEAVRSYDQFVRKKALSDVSEHDRAFKDHYLIYAKIKEQDPDGAEEVIRNHINRSLKIALNKKEN